MSWELAARLAGIFVIIALGWALARRGLFGGREGLRALSNAAFLVFLPALLFRSMVRLDLSHLPTTLLAAYFLPALGWQLLVWAQQRRQLHKRLGGAAPSPELAGRPAVRAVSATFGNGAQMGLPVAALLFGEAGLKLHVAIVSVHALILLGVPTVLAELDLARAQAAAHGRRSSLAHTVVQMLRQTLIHPVVLPILLGLAWNALGLPMPALLDLNLQMLGQAGVPLCLVLIGASLAQFGLGERARSAVHLSLAKLLVLPALVLLVAHWGFGVQGLPLAVAVICAAMPTGNNALLFATRYRTLEGEASVVIVGSTLAFAVTVPLWLTLLGWLGAF